MFLRGAASEGDWVRAKGHPMGFHAITPFSTNARPMHCVSVLDEHLCNLEYLCGGAPKSGGDALSLVESQVLAPLHGDNDRFHTITPLRPFVKAGTRHIPRQSFYRECYAREWYSRRLGTVYEVLHQ
ncbi:hypothetical protein FRC03_000461 [Tulasnella sp. 419]|nr:hypothetical protein FRC03_000461 [Tulasnella sp. 419]